MGINLKKKPQEQTSHDQTFKQPDKLNINW